MEAHVTPELEARLLDIASRTGRSPEQLAADALALGVEAEQRTVKAIEQGVASADAGRFIEDDQVLAWLEQQEARERP